MAEDGGIHVEECVDGDPHHWRITSSDDLFDPSKLTGTDFLAEGLFDLFDTGAFTETGKIIIHAFGVVRQVTTRFNPERPKSIDIIIDHDADLGNAKSFYHNLIMELSMQMAWAGGGGFVVNIER
mgnify:CR=1 FL=1